jgi:uncharacterized protein YaeQ
VRPSTIYRFPVRLAHVDRGVYQDLDLRLARHPSETERYLLTRLLAFCLLAEDGLAFSPGGLGSPDDPALALRTLDGRLALWVDIGHPSAERLHRAGKAAGRVVVVTSDPDRLRRELDGQRVHGAERLEVYAIAPAFLDALAAATGPRGTPLEVTISGGEMYVTAGGRSFHAAVDRVPAALGE